MLRWTGYASIAGSIVGAVSILWALRIGRRGCLCWHGAGGASFVEYVKIRSLRRNLVSWHGEEHALRSGGARRETKDERLARAVGFTLLLACVGSSLSWRGKRRWRCDWSGRCSHVTHLSSEEDGAGIGGSEGQDRDNDARLHFEGWRSGYRASSEKYEFI